MRPTKYGKEAQEKAEDYLLRYEELGDVVPTAAGLAVYLGVSKSTIYLWAEKNKDFSDTLKMVNAIQESRLSSGGLSNSMNASIVKLMLSNHGYSEKSQVDHVSSDESMKPTHIVLEGVDASQSKDTK
jgi:hypothetical protein